MQKPIITVDIDVEGTPEISVSGVQGNQCRVLTAELEKALGATIRAIPSTGPQASQHQAAQQANAGVAK